jgi:3-deoxy-D-manno-octulosonic-acid transferase
MRRLYDFSMALLGFGFFLARFFNAKAKQRWESRSHWKNEVPEGPYDLWMHCASLGEFDQGLPFLWAYKKAFPQARIVVSFFSPSGYNHYQKRHHCVDAACLLPLDTRSNAAAFLSHIQPKMVVFVKYEYWFNYIFTIKKRKIPLYSISTLLRKNQAFFKLWGGLFRKGLKAFSHFYVQNNTTKELLHAIQIDAVTVVGDTRYDHVHNQRLYALGNPAQNQPLEALRVLCKDRSVLVLGSSWLIEEEMVHAVYQSIPMDFTLIAPHDISEKHLYEIEAMFGDQCIRLSELSHYTNEKVVLIDCIGLLHQVYQLASIAIIGGGFTGKLHNILEPAAYGIPVMFGPKHSKFPEANLFLKKGLAQQFENEQELLDNIIIMFRKNALIRGKIEAFMTEQSGATEQIMADLLNTRVHSDAPSN